jgi:peptidoglycan/LPS O-acetylase OafA/YrhL
MGKIRELDGLRGLLAVWVVVVHLLLSVGVSPQHFGFFAPLFGEHLRVQIFCILSGFVIFLMQSRTRQEYGAFLSGRLRRLYPAYLLAFALSVGLSDLFLVATREADFGSARQASRLAALLAGQERFAEHVLSHLAMLHGLVPESWLPHAAFTFLGQAWNISTEFQFYLVAPLLVLGLTTGPWMRRAGSILFCLVLWWALRDWPNPADLAEYAPYFGAGIASFIVWSKSWIDRRLVNPFTVTGGAGAIFLLADMALGIWVFVLGWLLLRRDQGRSNLPLRWLTLPPMQWLGGISYSLYLLHMIPLYLGMYLLNGLGLNRASYLVLLTLFTFFFALPMAWASATQVEQRFYRNRPQQGLGQGRVVSVPAE